jgi:hypothetical protein
VLHFYTKSPHFTFKSLVLLCCLLCFHPTAIVKPSQQLKLFTEWTCQPHTKLPTRMTSVSLFVWIIIFINPPWGTLPAAGVALRIM